MKTLTLGFFFVAASLQAQVVISVDQQATPPKHTQVAASAGTQMAITDDLIVYSDEADFSKIILSLSGTSQDLTIARSSSTAITLGGLVVGTSEGGNGGMKSLYGGTWEVDGNLVFNDGVVVPQGVDGKLVHTLPNGSPGDILVNNPNSYVNGIFYSRGKGTRFFPIGNSSSNSYFPAQLSSVEQGDIEIGMRVVNDNSGLSGFDIYEDQHWEIIDPSNSFTDALVSLGTLNVSNFDFNLPTVIVGGSSTGQPGTSLEGSLSTGGDFFFSADKKMTISERIFTLAHVSRSEISVKIRNVITPFLDNANDYLEIENIHLFPDNKVTMLDRWGVLVKEWAGFTNVSGSPDASQDLSKVPTGNYIVILEYKEGSSLRKLSQMVTLINQ